ncbi:MAG: hypothetical protein PVI30_03350 [Myxococcales bacterium]|jgi:hypothetical protein
MRRLLVLAGATVLGLASFYPAWTNDLFGHLAAGRQIAALGTVPDHDTFSFYFDTPRPWLNHNWGSGLLFYGVFSALGYDGLVALKVAVALALGALLVATTDRRWTAEWFCLLLMAWAVPSVRLRLCVRPHIFGLLASAMLILALTRFAHDDRWTRGRRVWLWFSGLAALQVAWVNLHGSGPIAFLFVGAFLVGHLGDRRRQGLLLALLGVQAIASCVTPFGPAVLTETFKHVGSEGTRHFIGEWLPLHLSDNPWDLAWWAAMALAAGWSAPVLWRQGPAGRSELLVIAGMLLMATRSLRFVAHAFLLPAPFIAVGLASRTAALRDGTLRTVLAALTLLAAVAVPAAAANLPPFQPMRGGMSARNLPVQPGRWLARHHPRARIAGLMEDGWYLSFAVPDSQVLIDGRQAVYPLHVLQEVSRALEKPARLRDLLDRHDADAVVLRHNRPEHAASILALLRDPRFGLATVGDRHALFVRDLPPERRMRVLAPNMGLRSFDPNVRARARRELEGIESGPGSAAYVGLQRALLRLSDDLRDGGRNGLAAATDAETRDRFAAALRDLQPALDREDNFATAQILAALLNLRLCHLDRAQEALQVARLSGENRETVGLRIGLAIARGDREEAGRMLSTLDAQAGDPWLQELRRALRAGGGAMKCEAAP